MLTIVKKRPLYIDQLTPLTPSYIATIECHKLITILLLHVLNIPDWHLNEFKGKFLVRTNKTINQKLL